MNVKEMTNTEIRIKLIALLESNMYNDLTNKHKAWAIMDMLEIFNNS